MIEKCPGCTWDSTKRYQLGLIRRYPGYRPARVMGERPEHRCGRPTLTQLLNRELILAINTFRISSGLTRRPSSAELQRCLTMTLDELQLEGE